VRILRNNWPVVVAIAILWATILVLLRLSLAQNQGHLVYALDDGYVEIAIAKNFSHFGVWGVTRYGFTSATSSILWPLLLSIVYLVFGFGELAPFILNILSATMVVIAAYLVLKPCPLPSIYRLLLLLAVIFLTPLPTLAFTGMEHLAQILLHLVFAFLAASLLARESFAWSDRHSIALLALAPLVTSVRYEGLFLISVVCALLVLRRRVSYSVALGLLAFAPIGIYGLISVRHGALWLPNSVLLKGVIPIHSALGFLDYAKDKFLGTTHVSLLMMMALGAYFLRPRRPAKRWDQDQCLLIIFVGSSILHLGFAAVGWFYRYEAYLVALGILVSGKFLWQVFSAWANSERRQAFGLGIAAGVLPVLLISTMFVTIKRGVIALRETSQATTNIYDQQYQMATFLREYYQGGTVVANDVGAINVLGDIRCLDVFGLASMEAMRAKLENTYSGAKIYEMGKANNAQIAIVYDEWLDEYGGAPPQWTWLAEWRIPHNVICRSDRVQFYAVNPAEADNLSRNLEAFSTRLPPGVTAKGCQVFPPYVLGTRIDLTQPEADKYLCRGWSGHEPSLRWSDKKKAFIVFAFDEIKAGALRIKLAPFLAPGKVESQRVKVTLNDQAIDSFVLNEPKEFTFALPPTALREKNILTFELPDAMSPASLGISPDARLLGINADWMEIKPVAGGR
jgi:hypothetical protein